MRNTVETRFTRVQQAGEELASLLAPQDLHADFSLLEDWHEKLSELQKSIALQRANPDFAVVVFAGSSGSGKSNLLNALARENLSETGTSRPTTTDIRAFANREANLSSMREYSGLDITAVDATPGSFPSWLLMVEVPDRRLFSANKTQEISEVERILDLGDFTVWVTDPQRYADAEFLEDLQRWGNQQSAVAVLTHLDTLAAQSQETLVEDLQNILEKREISLPILTTSIFDDASLASFRQTLLGLLALPESRLRAMNSRFQKLAQKISSEAEVNEAQDLDSEPAEKQFCETIARACAVDDTQEQFQQSYLRGSRPYLVPPPLAWLAGAKPLSETAQYVAPQSNPQEIELASKHFLDSLTANYPPLWQRFFKRRAHVHALSLVGALDRAMASWEAPHLENQLWWRGFRIWQWITLILLAGTSIWTLIWLVCLLGGVSLPGSIGAIHLAPTCFAVTLLLVFFQTFLGMRLSKTRAKRFGDTAAQKFRQLLDEVSRKAFLDPMTKDITLYPQVRELTAQMGGL